ncbi:MAG: hypothetical protein ISN64_04285 [Rickettsia sp.]|nr:hypothetical protein [Rickettsia sp.]
MNNPIIKAFLAISYKEDSAVEKKILTEVKLPEWVLQEWVRNRICSEDLGKLEDMFKSINKTTDFENCLYEASILNNLEAFKFVLGN